MQSERPIRTLTAVAAGLLLIPLILAAIGYEIFVVWTWELLTGRELGDPLSGGTGSYWVDLLIGFSPDIDEEDTP